MAKEVGCMEALHQMPVLVFVDMCSGHTPHLFTSLEQEGALPWLMSDL